MSQPWKDAAVAGEGPPFAVTLAGRPIRTPLKRVLQCPTRPLADAIAAEWRAQGDRIEPQTMPLTRYMNSILDTVADNRAGVVDTIAAYAETDLLCYRAGHPQGLVERQTAAWDPPLTRLAQAHGAPMVVTTGILPVEQPAATLAFLRAAVEAHDDAPLAALHDLTALSGSLILGLAVSEGSMVPDDAWSASRIDEEWQIEQWGEDEEAAEAATAKRAAFMDAVRLLDLSRS
jgi:chaperone required for assembly of F1-ATPase